MPTTGILSLKLGQDQIFTVWEGNKKDYARNFALLLDMNYSHILFADGKMLGDPGIGLIYPFSSDPRKKRSLFEKNKITHAKMVCLSKGSYFPIPLHGNSIVRDGETNRPLRVFFAGTMAVAIDAWDTGSAFRFYRHFSPMSPADTMTVSEFSDKIGGLFVSLIAEVIRSCLEEKGYSAQKLSCMTPMDMMEVNEIFCRRIRELFANYGLTVLESPHVLTHFRVEQI